jgi:hypothetical protein
MSYRAIVHRTVLTFGCLFVGTAARGDVVELTTGGQLEGKVVSSSADDKTNFVIELSTGGQLVIPRSQVAKIDTVSAAESEYQTLARTSPDNTEGHWKLADWCRQHKLQKEYQQQLERILELDPNHADARAALGFREKDGQWLSKDDVMASRGLVMYEGRYVTPQHIQIMEQQKQAKETHADWTNKIEQLRRFLTGRRQDKAQQAKAELLSINDPDAAEAVVAILRRENDPDLKRFWIEVASHLNHHAAIEALVDLSLTDQDEEIRRLCIDYLVKSGRSGIATPYIRALGDKENEIINRAAIALGQIRDRDSLGPLIDALITKHKTKVAEGNPDQHSYSFSNEGNAFTFGGSAPQVITQAVRNQAVLDALTSMSGGANFEYDQDQWRGWLAAQAKANAVDVRRDR